MKPINMQSTREEVLAAVEAHSQLEASLDAYGDEEIDWRGDPPGDRQGCYWSHDRNVVVCMGRTRVESHVDHQRRAGEEDQADGAPEWGA